MWSMAVVAVHHQQVALKPVQQEVVVLGYLDRSVKDVGEWSTVPLDWAQAVVGVLAD